MREILLNLAIAGTVIVFTACGGGNPKSANIETTIKGIAVDELILNGKVEVKKPDSTLLIEGRTSAVDGSYTLELGAYRGPVVLTVTCDSDSRLLIEGTEKTCPTSMELNSVANVKGTEVTVHISPLTEIIYQRAVHLGTSGKVTEDSISKASNQVSVMFGVDPIANNPTVDTYAKIIKAFHAVAEADISRDLFAIINDFVDDMSDNVVDNSSALIDALGDENIVNNLTESSESSYIIPDNPASADGATQVKNMIRDLRTQATTMETYIKNEADDIGVALENTALHLQSTTELIVGIVELVKDARDDGNSTLEGYIWIDFRNTSGTVPIVVTQSNTNPNKWSYRVCSGSAYKGTVVLPELPNDIENTFNSLNATFVGALPYFSIDSSVVQNVALDFTFTKTGNGADLSVSNASMENNGTTISVSSLNASIGYSSDGTFNYVKLHDVVLNGTTGGYSAIGTLTVPEYVINSSLPTTGLEEVKSWNVGVTLTCTGLSDASAEIQVGDIRYTHDNSYGTNGRAYFYFYDIYRDWEESDIEEAIITDGSCSDGSSPQVTIDIWNYMQEKFGNSGFVPSKLSFVGSIKNTQTSGEINGTVNIELLNATTINLVNYDNIQNITPGEIALKVDISGRLNMPSRPETLVNLSYETKVDDDEHRHSIAGSYSHNTTILTLAGSIDKSGKNANIVLTDGAGVEASFILSDDSFVNGNAANSTGSLVTKDGQVVATIEERGDDLLVIKYLDGSFESIF